MRDLILSGRIQCADLCLRLESVPMERMPVKTPRFRLRFRLPRLAAVAAIIAALAVIAPARIAMASSTPVAPSTASTAVRAPVSDNVLAKALPNGRTGQAAAADLSKWGGDPRVSAYWTPQRMEHAIPADTPQSTAAMQGELRKLQDSSAKSPGGILSEPVAATDRRITPQTAPPVTNFSVTAGKVFFHNQTDGNDYICSGSAVNSDSKRLVITAGHCVYGGPGNQWHTNWEFIPDYYQGSAPYGTFQAAVLRTYDDWINYGETGRGFNSDVGFATTYSNASGQLLVNAVGGNGTQWGGSTNFDADIFGYPGNLNNGEIMWACWGTTGTQSIDGYNFSSISGCNFGGGSSGGPWLASYSNSTGLGYVHSITSNGPVGSTAYINGPYFDSRFPTLFAAANADW